MLERPHIVKNRTEITTPSLHTFNVLPDPKRLIGLAPSLRKYRENAWKTYSALPFPDKNQDAWRRTELTGLRISELKMIEESYLDDLPLFLRDPLTSEKHAGLILISGYDHKSELDQEIERQGVIFTDLRNAEKKYPSLLLESMNQAIKAEEGKFAAMAASFAGNGIFLYIPKGVHVEHPLHSILWGAQGGTTQFTQIVILLEEGASATYIHESSSEIAEKKDALHAGTVEIILRENAKFNFVELQSWGENIWNFSHERAILGENAQMDWVFGAIGSHLTKNFTDLNLNGRGAIGKMSGFYFTDHYQHLDHDTQQNHMAPETTSDLLFKGALADKSRSVWQGMIYVAPGAYKTDGYQANRNLIISREARADSIPGLEILADDVRCTHGATVGKIDADQMFYLQSRGIPELEAKKLIVEGFFEPIMERIPFEGVRQRFVRAIQAKMTGISG